MKTLLSMIRRSLSALGRESRRDDGVLALVIAIALIAGAAALIASTARQSKEAQVTRQSQNAKAVGYIKNSVLSYFLLGTEGSSSAPYALPCPDVTVPPDGLSDEAAGCTTNVGVLPWRTLRLNESDAIDSYGNYFTYAVTTTGRNMCDRVTNDYNSATSFDGATIDASDTESLLTTETAAQSPRRGAPFYFAILSHGPNGLGAISSSGTRRATPVSTYERQNCPTSNSNCTRPNSTISLFSGPKNSTSGSDYFDDTVFLGDQLEVEKICQELTTNNPGDDPPDVDTDFNSGTLPSSLVTTESSGTGAVSVQQSSIAGRGRVLRFTGSDAVLSTTYFNYDPLARPNYVSFEWTPTVANGTGRAGMALGLRATPSDRTDGSGIFDAGNLDGLSIYFFENTANNANGGTNYISICDSTTAGCTSATNLATSFTAGDSFTISLNSSYTIEAFDNGSEIWARITQVGTPANTATLFYAVPVANQDLRGQSAALFMSFLDSTSELDNLLLRRGGMAVTFDGAGDIIDTSGDNHDTASGNLTLEAWVRPTSLPTGSTRQTIIAKWVENGTTGQQSYRLSQTANGLVLEIAADDAAGGTNIVTNPFSFGSRLTLNEWSHVAASYSASTRTATFYVEGQRVGTSSASSVFSTTGVNDSSATFTVGADRDNGSAISDVFIGQITDVRVWSTVRLPQDISFNRRKRLRVSDLNTSGVDDDLTGLIVNWTLDTDTLATFSDGTPTAEPTASFDATSSPSPGASGTITGGSYIAIRQNFIPPNGNAVCGTGTRAGAFRCDYRVTTQSGARTMPDNLPSLFVKVWGSGGGAYQSAGGSDGGGGGMSAARLRTVGTTPIAASSIRVDIASGGTGSTNDRNGAGGGGASGLWRDQGTLGTLDAGDTAGVFAGGGGGAGYGDDDFTSQDATFNCDAANECGPGGGGGGPFNVAGLTAVATVRAVDDNENMCGGRGGDNVTFGNNPPDPAPGGGGTNTCDDDGDDPTSATGATGGGANAGGSVLVGSGGAGYDGPMNRVGPGGGGGGVRLSDLSAGGGEGGGSDGGGATNNGADGNRASFGGGGGAGFVDDTASAAFGSYGNAAGFASGTATNTRQPGNVTGVSTTTDPDHAPAFCSSGVNCVVDAGFGGAESGAGAESGRRGIAVLKW
ncbi:MAG: LamG domain-containing protein [Rhodospirillaceae bacterium]|nr:LamG domain-containing protein [Rhodospirillaceae bacterium]